MSADSLVPIVQVGVLVSALVIESTLVLAACRLQVQSLASGLAPVLAVCWVRGFGSAPVVGF